MAKRWCFFTLDSEEDITNWWEAVEPILRAYAAAHGYESSNWTDIERWAAEDKTYGDLLRLEGVAEEAEPGQYVVLNKRLYALAKKLDALPKHVESFAACEEGVPSGVFEGKGREIVPGVSESTSVMLGMARKGEKRRRAEISRADIEGALRRYDEERDNAKEE